MTVILAASIKLVRQTSGIKSIVATQPGRYLSGSRTRQLSIDTSQDLAAYLSHSTQTQLLKFLNIAQ